MIEGIKAETAKLIESCQNTTDPYVDNMVQLLNDFIEQQLTDSQALITLGQAKEQLIQAKQQQQTAFEQLTAAIEQMKSLAESNLIDKQKIEALIKLRDSLKAQLNDLELQLNEFTAKIDSKPKPVQTPNIFSTVKPIHPTKANRFSLFANTNTISNALSQQLKNLGLKLIPIVPDGHCLYSSVKRHINKEVKELRELVAEHMAKNKARFSGFITLSEGQTWDNYIDALKTTNAWAGNVEIKALMEILNRPIVVIGPDCQVINSIDIQGFTEEPIFVSYNGINHYDALDLLPGSTGQSVLTRLTGKTAVNRESSNTCASAK